MSGTTLRATCNDCESEFQIVLEALGRGTRDDLRCPVCTSNVLRVAIDHPADEWDGTLESTNQNCTKSFEQRLEDVADEP